jgi:hypothetical protein
VSSARHQLVLLGFLCVGLSWDDYLLPLASVLLWVSCLTWLRGCVRFHPNIEGLLLAAGCLLAFLGGRLFGKSTHFFLGHGLTFIQAARLLRPLNRREKVFSLLVALAQIAAGCTFLFDLRFVPAFAAVVFLLPRALLELEAEACPAPASALRPPLGLGATAAVATTAILFFLVFPRGFLGTALPALRPSPTDLGSLLDSVVDPTRRGLAQSRRVLLQIEGAQIGYLRCYGLAECDGVRWSAAAVERVGPIYANTPEERRRSLYRRVHVRQANYLGRVLPTDGHAIEVRGKFFRRPLRNAQGAIECEALWNSANTLYEYWTIPDPKPEPLPRPYRGRFLRHPPQSARLSGWLETVLAGATNALAQARRLEAHLQTQFTYKLGAPELSRLSPVDDFIFHQREGHCERFASTLALLLRMKGIPSRVVIGYLPRSRSWTSGWHNVRFSDAHAWTEGYVDGLGWVRFDATPAATLPAPGLGWRDLWDTLDLAWTMKVVNFDGPAQLRLWNVSLQGLAQSAKWVERHAALLFGLGLAVAVGLGWQVLRQRMRWPWSLGAARRQPHVLASHYYGQMLRALARQGFHRQPQQTPLEFLSELRQRALARFEDARFITVVFCQSRYGHHAVAAARQAEIEQALERMRETG